MNQENLEESLLVGKEEEEEEEEEGAGVMDRILFFTL